MRLAGQVIITQEIGKSILALEGLRGDENLVEIITPSVAKELEELESVRGGERHLSLRTVTPTENFRLDDAKLAIEKAYIAHEVESFIILASHKFSAEVQNKLLKVIEEPPSKVSFILLAPSKSGLLATVRSRLPVTQIRERKERLIGELNMRDLDLKSTYEFIQNNKRVNTVKAKEIVEHISVDAIHSQKFHLDHATLQLMHNAYKALDMGSPPQFVFTTLLLKLLAKKRREK